MLELNLYSIIEKYQNGDNECILLILQRFDPLLKSYSKRFDFNREDAYADLRMALLSMLKSVQLENLSSHSNGTITLYIKQTVHNSYISYSKKHCKARYSFIDDLNGYDACRLEEASCTNDIYADLIKTDLNHILTPKEMCIICKIYVDGYSVSELAYEMGKTRQAINQAKNIALNKLRKKWK